MNIKELAEQVGISFGGHPMNPLSVYFSELTRFAELVAAAEREKCAELCVTKLQQTPYGGLVAAAIRARENNNG